MLKKIHRTETLAYWAFVFLLFAGASVVGHVLSQRSVLYDFALPIPLRLSLICYELTLLALALCLYGGLTALMSSLFLRVPIVNTIAVRRLTFLVSSWLFVFLYAVSWGSFKVVGIFFGYDSALMLMNDPVQIFQHASHIALIPTLLIPFATLLIALGIAYWLPPVMAAQLAIRQKRLLLALSSVLLVCLFGSVSGVLIAGRIQQTTVDQRTGITYSVTERYKMDKEEVSGPFAFFVADVSRTFFPHPSPHWYAEAAEIHQNPIMTMEEYVSQVDANTIKKKNVIVILIESLRADQLPSFNGDRNVMPALQQLAEESFIFTNAYTQSSHSNYADLSPLSSHYPLRSRTTHFYPKNPTYPRVLIYDVLKHFGYTTAIFSSQNENWGGMANYLDTGNIDHFLHAETYTGPLNLPRSESLIDKWMLGDKRAGKIDDRFTVNEAIKWISSQGDKPFFIYMNLQTSHFPYDIPTDFPRRFATDEEALPKFMGSSFSFQVKSMEIFRDLYADSLAYIDTHLNRLFEHLKSQDLWNDTIIVVSADTATAFFEHNNMGNGADLYNEIIKVPLMIRDPSLSPGTDDRLIQHIDIPPSVFDLLGLPSHPSFQGLNAFAETFPEDRPVFVVSQSPMSNQYAIIQGDWKLIFDVRYNRFTLYNLKDDPTEHRDLSRDRADVVRTLARDLMAWVDIQLSYYQRKELYPVYYPPVLVGENTITAVQRTKDDGDGKS